MFVAVIWYLLMIICCC